MGKLQVVLLLLVLGIHIYAEKPPEQRIAQLEKKLETVSGKEKIDVLNHLASLLYTGNPAKCIEYCSGAIDLAAELDYPGGKARALVYKSYALSVQGERKKVLDYGKEALQIFESLGDKKGTADAANAVGYFYLRLNYYNMALDYFLKILKLSEELDNKSGILEAYWNLGILYLNLKDYQKALTFFQDALKILEQTGDNERRGRFFHNTGIVYRELKDFDNALEYFQNALKIFETVGDRFWISAALGNIGVAFKHLNNYPKALDYSFRALRISEDLGNASGTCINLLDIGEIYARMNGYNQAISYYNRAEKIAVKINSNDIWLNTYKKYSELYEAAGDHIKALEYYKLFMKKKDEILDLGKRKQVAEMQEKYETEKKTRQIVILEKESEIQKVTRNALVAIVVLAAIILFLLFKKYLYLFAFWKKQKYIGGYRLMEIIGSGGMGTVYHAHNIRDKSETAAVKILNDEFFKDENSRKRFKQEGTIIESLDHPNIVKIYERGEQKDKLYIAMEYLRGKTLAQKIEEQGRIDPDQCLHIMIRIADALAFIHGKTIIHRDLKPENIMLTRRDGGPDMVKLLDFGLARTRFQSRLTRTGVLLGTIAYMSPEQVTGRPSSAASDVYALGVVFYRMLTGRRAFEGDSITDIADKILKSIPEEPKKLLPEIPDVLNRLIVKMLSKEPEQRPPAELVLKTLSDVGEVWDQDCAVHRA
ncbi:MAG: protein kinase [bacterium]|nr:protein kinase [bacterium]